MINKKNVLGKHPEDLGAKDAIHVAIVSVRAGKPINPGERCGLNEFNEAVPNHKGPGVADPFLDSHITTGESFWLLLDQDEVPNVQHVWVHKKFDFSPPTRKPNLNSTILDVAKRFGVTYEQVMKDCAWVVEHDRAAPYPGDRSREQLEDEGGYLEDMCQYDLWSEWASETGYEFSNNGTECCPEYAYPDCGLYDILD